MIAGTLEVQMLMNLARLSSEVTQAKGLVGGMSKEISRYANVATNALGAIGVGLSVAGILAFSKHTIDAIANMKDLAQEAGTTAAAISRFEAPARSAGLGLDAVAGAMFRMSKAALEARDPQSKAAQALSAIGISTAQLKGLKPDEMFELVARSLAKYGDGLSKNAVMQELFNRSGKDMNKVVAEIAQTGQLAATVTEQEAEAAKKFNDGLLEVKMNSEKFWRSLASEGLPALNSILKAFIDARREGSLFDAVMASLFETFQQMKGKGPAAELKAVEDAIKNAQLDLASATTGLRSLTITDGERATKAAELNKLLAERERIQHIIFAEELAAQNKRILAGQTAPKPAPAFDPAAAAAAKAALDAYNSEVAALEKEKAAITGVSEMEAYRDKLRTASFEKLSASQRRALEDRKLENLELKTSIEYTAAYNKVLDELDATEQARIDHARQIVESMKDSNERLAFENSLIGMNAEDRARANVEYERMIALRGVDSPLAIAEINRAYDLKAALVAQGLEMERHLDLWTQLADAAGNFFSDLVMHGRSAFDNLKKFVKDMIAQMIALFAKRWILNMVAGGSVGDAASAAAGQTASGSLGGSLIGAAGNYIAGAAGFTGLGTFAEFAGAASGAIPAGAIGAGAVEAGVGVNTFAAGLGSQMSGVYAALASVPVWGWIAMAVIAIGAWIAGSHKGGDKYGGSYFTGGDVPGTDNGRFFTPNQADSTLRTEVDKLVSGFGSLVSRLGGQAGTFGFGVGFDHDPAGTAQSRVSSMLTGANGSILYQNLNHSMDDKEVPAAVALELKRELLAALQATKFDDELTKIFGSITDIASATSEQIDAVLAQALAMKQLEEALSTVDLKNFNVDSLRAFALEGETLEQTFNRVGGAWSQLEGAFTSDDVKLGHARDQLTAFTAVLASSGMQMPKTRDEWLEVMRGLDLSTESGRTLFTQMMNLAPAFDLVSTAAAQMMSDFDALMGQIRPGYTEQMQGAQLTSAAQQFMANNAWTSGMSVADFLTQIRTITREDFAGYSLENQKLILTILGLDHTLNTTNTSVSNLATAVQTQAINPAYTNDPNSLYGGLMSAFEQRFGGVIGSQPNLTAQTNLRASLMFEEIQRLNARQAELQAVYGPTVDRVAEFQANARAMAEFTRQVVALQSDMGRLTILTAQYGQATAEQLVQLEHWRDEQLRVIGDNQDAILALEQIFGQRRQAIIAGNAAQEIEQLQRVRDEIGKWRDALLLGDTSPLTTRERFQEAQRQYQDTRTAAFANDPTALANYTQIADQLLRAGIDMFGRASVEYGAIFDTVRGDSGSLASGLPRPDPPTGGQLMAVHDAIVEQNTLLRDEIQALSERIERLQRSVEEGAGEQAAATIEAANRLINAAEAAI